MRSHRTGATLVGVLWLGSGVSAEPNQIPMRDGATLTQLPHFGWSSFGVNLLLTEDRMLMCSDTPSNSLDLTTPDAIWAPFHGEDASLGLDERHYGMAVDPVNPDVFYYCGGSVSDKNMSYQVGFENGSLHRSLDGLTSSSRAFWSRPTDPADQTRMENYALGCAADLGSGLRNDGFPGEGTRPRLFAHGPRFAFDATETVAVRDASWPPEQPSVTVSKRLYFMSYLHGLWEGSYGSDGLVHWSRIHGAPEYCESLAADCSCGSVDLASADTKHFDFGYPDADECPEPTDGVSCSDVETGVELRLVERVVDVDDIPTVVRTCQEIEKHWVGTSVTVDPENASVLYAGYAVTQEWPSGGLYRLVRQPDGSFTETRLSYVDPITGDRDLDVRDIAIDPLRTIVTDSMGTVSQFIYVAAGSDGMFRVEVQSDGTVDLQEFNSGLYPRRRYLEDYAGGVDTPCCSTPDRCGESVAIDQGQIGGQSYLVLIDGDNPGGAYYAAENYTDTVDWTRIYNLGSDGSYTHQYAQSIVVDDANERFLVATGGAFLFEINVPADLPSASVDCGSLEVTTWTQLPNIGMATNAFQDVVYDPVLPDSRLHATTFDEGYSFLEWDPADLTSGMEDHVRRADRGYCLYAEIDLDGSGSIDDATERVRYSSYAARLIPVRDAGTEVLYLAANSSGKGGIDGAIYRGVRGDSDGRYVFSLATGDTGCVASGDTACTYVDCDNAPVAEGAILGRLPVGRLEHLAVAPLDAQLLRVIVQREDETFGLYQSANGGLTWSDLSEQYKFWDPDQAQDMNLLGEPTDLIFDPQDSGKFFVAFGECGIFQLDDDDPDDCSPAVPGIQPCFRDITNPQVGTPGEPDDVLVDRTIFNCFRADAMGRPDRPNVPSINDIEAVIGGDGFTHLYLAVGATCERGSPISPFPQGACYSEGGGVYERAPADPLDVSWSKLNTPSGAVPVFHAMEVEVSPIDPQTIVVTGSTDNLTWAGRNYYVGDGNVGIMYSRDGGLTFALASERHFLADAIDPHPVNPDRFLVYVKRGLWQLDFPCRDPDSDGVCNTGAGPIDNCLDVSNPSQSDLDGDGQGDTCDFDSDWDGDGVVDGSDCVPADPAAWSVPSDLAGLLLAKLAGTVGLRWDEPPSPGATVVGYDVIRSDIASDFVTGAFCVESDDDSDLRAFDPEDPAVAFFYLVRSVNMCGEGIAGYGPDREVRPVRACP